MSVRARKLGRRARFEFVPGPCCPSSRRRTHPISHSARSGFVSRSTDPHGVPSAQFGIAQSSKDRRPARPHACIRRPSTTFAAAWCGIRRVTSEAADHEAPCRRHAEIRGHFGKEVLQPVDEARSAQSRYPARDNRDERRVGHGNDDVAGAHEPEKSSTCSEVEANVIERATEKVASAEGRRPHSMGEDAIDQLLRRK